MTGSLVFPDGVRLARREDIPDPNADAVWARIEKANIEPGFDIKKVEEGPFSHYAQINVNGPSLWDLVCDLSRSILGEEATLLMGEEEGQPASLGAAPIEELIALLEPYSYGLAHDGFLRFGLMTYGEKVSGLVVEPTKYFKVWMSADEPFLAAMARQNLVPRRLEFIDQYANVSQALPVSKLGYPRVSDLMENLANKIAELAKRE